jgi:dTDP-4-dehydrorhamnose 3,5-epimerase
VIFEPTPIDGAFVVRIERRDDDRGFFARIWCRDEFAAHGIDSPMVQASLSHNRIAGTLRGLHFAWPPAREGKLVRCERGRIHDVIVDLRPDSPSYTRHFALQLDDDACNALYVPPLVAHGFQTLVADCHVVYMMSEAYRPEAAGGVRYDDSAFGVRWPLPVVAIAERDRAYPDFDRRTHESRCTAAALH